MRLIDADELKKPVGSYNPVKYTWEYGYVISVEDIDHAPTVEPVKHGQWIKIGEIDKDGNQYYQCSKCGKGERHVPIIEVKYCWNCGTKMDGEIRWMI